MVKGILNKLKYFFALSFSGTLGPLDIENVPIFKYIAVDPDRASSM
jgi:hypothetical protein